MKSCEYEIADETIDTSTARRSEEEKDRRLGAEKDRRRAEEMDRIKTNCMKSRIEALQELERAKLSTNQRLKIIRAGGQQSARNSKKKR